MQRSSSRGVVGLAAGLMLAAVVAWPVAATTAHPRVTRGAAEAIFQARTTANQIQVAHGKTTSAVRRAFINGRISPFFDGQSFCSRDWVVLLVSFGAGGSHREAVTELARNNTTFTLDGQLVATRQTVVKPFLTVPPSDRFWGNSTGHLFPPGTLADGEHTLQTVITYDGVETQFYDITFTVGAEFCD